MLLNVDCAPQGPEDFDRLLINSPNDSLLWMHYMAFYIHTTEIDKAWAIGQRALQTISFRSVKTYLIHFCTMNVNFYLRMVIINCYDVASET